MLGWSSGDLARQSNIHRRTIRKLEKGEVNPQAGTLRRIVAALVSTRFQQKGQRRARDQSSGPADEK